MNSQLMKSTEIILKMVKVNPRACTLCQKLVQDGTPEAGWILAEYLYSIPLAKALLIPMSYHEKELFAQMFLENLNS